MDNQHCDHTLLEAFLEFGDLRGFEMQILKDNTGRMIGSVDFWDNNYFFANSRDHVEAINEVLFSDRIRNTEYFTVIMNSCLLNEDLFWAKNAFKTTEECLMKRCNPGYSGNTGFAGTTDLYSYRYVGMLDQLCSIFLLDPTFRVMTEYLTKNCSDAYRDVQACVAFLNEQPVGVLVRTCKADFIRIEWVYTLPEFRNKGVLKALFNEVLHGAAKDKRPVYIKISSQFELYFRQLGFNTCERAAYFKYRFIKPVEIHGLPMHAGYNSVLRSKHAFRERADLLKAYNLPIHFDGPKNWDSFAALDIILRHSGMDRESKAILDAGGEPDSAILPQLEACGFKNLQCINLSITEAETVGHIYYCHGDITSTSFADETFDFIVCLSVIEHGVDLCSFFREMNRILRKGGLLITSTDYWRTPIDTRGKVAYQSEVRVFNEDDMLHMTGTFDKFGFVLKEPLDLLCDQKIVKWLGMNYTFIYFTLEKR